MAKDTEQKSLAITGAKKCIRKKRLKESAVFQQQVQWIPSQHYQNNNYGCHYVER
jgi:hypothetical protein